jgi:CBS domain-containing protein
MEATMKARDVMTTAVHTVGPDASVTDIAQLLLDRRISGVPVVDAAGHVLGVVSEGDLMRRPESGTIARRSWWLALVASNDELARDYVKTHGTKARDVMSRPAVTIDAGAELAAVAALLEKRRIKRLPVLQDGKLVGIVTRSNLLHGLIAHRAGSPAKSDADIRKQIENELEGEAWANLRTTNVVVMDGVAHLWSMVGSESERHALIVAAERIPGVQRVEEHIAVLVRGA